MYHEAIEAFFEEIIYGKDLDDVMIDIIKTTLYDLITNGKIEIPEKFLALAANDHDMPDPVGGIDLNDDGGIGADGIDFNHLLSSMNPKLFKQVDANKFLSVAAVSKKNNDIVNMLFAKPTGSETIAIIQPTTNEALMNAPCKYNTFVTSSFKLISDHYHYGNVVEGVSICSHPSVVNRPSSSVTPCLQMHDQVNCDMYANNVQVLATANAPIVNTDRVQQFSLTYTPMINFFEGQFAHAFVIQNMDDNSVVSQMLIPDHEFVYDEARVEAERIFDEYMTAYTQISKTGPIVTEESESSLVPTQSYFAQLFS